MCTSCKVQINGKGGQFYIAANTSVNPDRIDTITAKHSMVATLIPTSFQNSRFLMLNSC